jgi:Flp pilus assembly protein TadB
MSRAVERRELPPPQEMGELRARRRDARRRRRLARMDLGLGVVGAIVLLVATPGLAIAALIALLVLLLCGLSFFLERRRRVRATRAAEQRPRRTPASARPQAGVPRERRRPSP